MEQSKLLKREIKNRDITLVIVAIIIVGLIIMNIRENHLLEKEHRYTIGKIYEIRGTSSGYCPHYIYYVNGKKYDGSMAVEYPDYNIIGKRYVVKFYPPNPDICNILLNKPVDDSIKKVPNSGWNTNDFIIIFGNE